MVPEHALADDRARPVLERLHALDQAQREAGLPTEQRIRSVTPPTGAFLYATVLALRPSRIFEMGSSVGYSTIWLALAARAYGGRVIGSELLPERAEAANQHLREAGLDAVAEVRTGDAAEIAGELDSLGLVFIDAEKDDYTRLFEAVIDHVLPGGLILTDNVVSHDCTAYLSFLRQRSDVTTVTLSYERGIEWTVKGW
ncbi:class I SAM-dependent methyltransferase [Thermomicrobiaceae bacterium CFH 74404]|uniref:Class I SAM-dependent methyltransferase n=1 Tax=Thermalbibacter longus TaxID=2951981 RepID=A0AA41WC44_9BACT|nr:class I SAM-dependent methyltransferase [Thermalbibacter longus]MCM8749197.1 class I SAM-dependent methyltransferase [Thermalbibacter longus]